MKPDVPHILCVNPWIHDFAAFDFWAKPLGLLGLAALLRRHGLRVTYKDCLDRFHPKAGPGVKTAKDGRGPYRKTPIRLPEGLQAVKKRFSRYGVDPEWFRADLKAIEKPDLIFVTSGMTYWAPGVKETIAVIKEIFPEIPVILGGIYATLCTEHAKNTTLADQVVSGPGEDRLKNLVETFTGFIFSSSFSSEDLDSFPYPALEMVSKLTYAPILTSRGCPFKCEYCASSFLEARLRRRSPEAVFDEIKYWHTRYGVKNFAFYDDALLVGAEHHALIFLEKVAASGMKISFHTPNALHVRQITAETANLMARAGFQTIRLGLETTDFSSGRDHDHKVNCAEIHACNAHLKSAGFSSNQVGAYLLCALPGQSLKAVEQSIGFVKSLGITPVLAYYTPIPHTPLWKTAVKNSRFDLEKDPVFSNNALFPCLDIAISEQEIARLKALTRP